MLNRDSDRKKIQNLQNFLSVEIFDNSSRFRRTFRKNVENIVKQFKEKYIYSNIKRQSALKDCPSIRILSSIAP